MTTIHTTCILAEKHIKYVDEVIEWNKLTDSYNAVDFSSKLEYIHEIFHLLLKSKLIERYKKNIHEEDDPLEMNNNAGNENNDTDNDNDSSYYNDGEDDEEGDRNNNNNNNTQSNDE